MVPASVKPCTDRNVSLWRSPSVSHLSSLSPARPANGASLRAVFLSTAGLHLGDETLQRPALLGVEAGGVEVDGAMVVDFELHRERALGVQAQPSERQA